MARLTKVQAEAERIDEQQKFTDLWIDANKAKMDFAAGKITLTEAFDAVSKVTWFAAHRLKHVRLDELDRETLRLHEEWLDENRPAYDKASRLTAWASLPDRLRKWASEREEVVAKLANDLIAASRTNSLMLPTFEWADKAVTAAAERDVALILVEWVRMLTDKGEVGEVGFKLLAEEVRLTLLQQGRKIARSTSPSSNLATDASRVAWFAMANKLPWFEMDVPLPFHIL